jgi:hypothetical protein
MLSFRRQYYSLSTWYLLQIFWGWTAPVITCRRGLRTTAHLIKRTPGLNRAVSFTLKPS